MICRLDRLGRARIAKSPCPVPPMAGPSAAPQARIVELVQVDVVGLEPLQALLEREPDEVRREVLRALALASASVGVGVEVIAELGADRHLAAAAGERLSQNGLAPPVAVGVSGIKERHAQI